MVLFDYQPEKAHLFENGVGAVIWREELDRLVLSLVDESLTKIKPGETIRIMVESQAPEKE